MLNPKILYTVLRSNFNDMQKYLFIYSYSLFLPEQLSIVCSPDKILAEGESEEETGALGNFLKKIFHKDIEMKEYIDDIKTIFLTTSASELPRIPTCCLIISRITGGNPTGNL